MKFFSKMNKKRVLKKNLKNFSKLAEEDQAVAIQKATLLVHGKAIKSIQDNSTGTPDIRYSPKRAVVVSKPGKAPNTDTGTLVKSIQFEFEDDGLTGKVGTNLKYGVALEFGTSRMAARPWLRPAVNKNRKQINNIFAKTFEKTMKKAKKKVKK